MNMMQQQPGFVRASRSIVMSCVLQKKVGVNETASYNSSVGIDFFFPRDFFGLVTLNDVSHGCRRRSLRLTSLDFCLHFQSFSHPQSLILVLKLGRLCWRKCKVCLCIDDFCLRKACFLCFLSLLSPNCLGAVASSSHPAAIDVKNAKSSSSSAELSPFASSLYLSSCCSYCYAQTPAG